ncbi:MAG: lytic transglycosylase domain-containing protein [Rhodospirillales bacterium]|nr:lytic transglycosylase domain-containing protein [Rhodospirillales bacterium]
MSNSTRGFGREVEFPQILSATDVETYRRIFEIQKTGKWPQADRLIKQLENKVLLGHVLAQRYLHPTKYRSKYKELKDWMELYADHPDAKRLYRLALRRKPENWKAPRPPIRVSGSAVAAKSTVLRIPSKKLSAGSRSKVRSLKRHIRNALRKGHTLVAKRALESKSAKTLFSPEEYDEYAAKLGQSYFSAGRDDWAVEWAGAAAERSGKYVPQAYWTAGLALWRLGDKEKAASYFANAAKLSRDNDWFHAAAAFWAARAYLVTRQPRMVNGFLEKAAENGRTFYGLLARRVLGKGMGLNWSMPSLDVATVEKLTDMPRGQRAVALLQVGSIAEAERELRIMALGATEDLAKGILALAARGNMASLAVRLDHQLYPNGGGFDGAAYPIPAWTPGEGFRVDRALIYALIRQESKFNPNAKSWAGARGLMQLMPGTASFVARDRQFRSNKRSDLFLPELNMTLGQKYIEILLKDKKIDGSLFLMAAAWNGGPGNLNKWRKSTEYMDDPLFFIESIPARETRNFIEHVLSNLWIYRDRLGQQTPSLDTIAAGLWPQYTALGQDAQEVAARDVTGN